MQRFVVIIIIACPLFAIADWVEQRLTLEWRNWLTSYLLRAYFAERSFFKLKQQAGSLDNPDQVPNNFTWQRLLSCAGGGHVWGQKHHSLCCSHLLQHQISCNNWLHACCCVQVLMRSCNKKGIMQQKGNVATGDTTDNAILVCSASAMMCQPSQMAAPSSSCQHCDSCSIALSLQVSSQLDANDVNIAVLL